ncbi:DUF2178 domain-containing protein [Natronobiforma cellulositropha]
MHACLGVGIVGYLAGLRLEVPFVALGIYWVAFLAFLAVWKGSPVTLYDERHDELEKQAGALTMGVAGAALILVGPALPALGALGYEVSDVVLGALFGYAALFGVWAVAYGVVSRYS